MRRLLVTLGDGAIRRVQDGDGRDLAEARIDPAHIATLHGPKQEERRLVRLEDVPTALLLMLQAVEDLPQVPWLQVIAADDPRLEVFADALASGEPLCGRLLPARNALLYREQAGQVQSSALLPLPGLGLLAIGSTDPNRFYPGMGTVFLHMMAQSLLTALARFR